jgi:hypothetical protein
MSSIHWILPAKFHPFREMVIWSAFFLVPPVFYGALTSGKVIPAISQGSREVRSDV